MPKFVRFLAAVFFTTMALQTWPAKAAPGQHFTVDRVDPSILAAAVNWTEGPVCNEGEITPLPGSRLLLQGDDGNAIYRLRRETRVYINGQPANPESLKPMTPDAYFWAKIWADRTGGLILIEAVYSGGELSVIGLQNNVLTGICPETGEQLSLPLRSSFHPGLLTAGQLIYVLLDLEGRVRWLHRLTTNQ